MSTTRIHAAPRNPVLTALMIVIAFEAFVIVGALVLAALDPGLAGYGSGLSQSLVLILLAVPILAGLLTLFNWWRRAGFVGRSHWRETGLFVLPAAFLLLPFVNGIKPIAPDQLALLAAGYLATGFVEEALFRGTILEILRPSGVWRAVIISSLLFGLVHLANVLFRGNLALAVLQAIGAGTEGVGLAALRLRTRTIWPLIFLHAFHDLFLQMGYLPVPLVSAAFSIVLLVYGIYLLRGRAVRERISQASLGEAIAVNR